MSRPEQSKISTIEQWQSFKVSVGEQHNLTDTDKDCLASLWGLDYRSQSASLRLGSGVRVSDAGGCPRRGTVGMEGSEWVCDFILMMEKVCQRGERRGGRSRKKPAPGFGA